MERFESLYNAAVNAAVGDDLSALFNMQGECDEHHLDCLLRPKSYPPVVRLGNCTCEEDGSRACENVCFYKALSHDEQGNVVISAKDCVGCGECIASCEKNNLTDIREVVPIFELINSGVPVYVLIAPAFLSQFSPRMTPGKLRSAFKALGFAGMIEVALFADILTLKEALEFNEAVTKKEDFILTSCCCPMWVGMIRKVYSTLAPHMPPSVSPMVASGRAIKKLHPESKTVFIGPCIAKKGEARQPDIEDAVDFVLTFQETDEIFRAAGIDPEALEEDLRDHSSAAGRIYARTGGVSKAVEDTVERLFPERDIKVKAMQADGVPTCKALLKEVMEGKIDANFIEGMGCPGGCVGGPKALINRNEGAKHVDSYAAEAEIKTPADNPFVLEMLARLGFDTIESLKAGHNMFTRDFK
jgi:iron only hydrogenase large subunit-like protein